MCNKMNTKRAPSITQTTPLLRTGCIPIHCVFPHRFLQPHDRARAAAAAAPPHPRSLQLHIGLRPRPSASHAASASACAREAVSDSPALALTANMEHPEQSRTHRTQNKHTDITKHTANTPHAAHAVHRPEHTQHTQRAQRAHPTPHRGTRRVVNGSSTLTVAACLTRSGKCSSQ